MSSMDLSGNIVQFLENKTLLVTGATGFLAKVFIEKVLRIQPNIKKLYLLVRATDVSSAAERLQEEVLKKDLFRVLRENLDANLDPFFYEKIAPVPGDTSCENLGVHDLALRDEIWRTTDIVVNSAATTNFDERYDVAFSVNTLGPLNVLNFAKKCPQLKMLLHVSTGFSKTLNGGFVSGIAGINQADLMASRGERRMIEEVSETPKLGVWRDGDEMEEEEAAAGGIAGLVGCCEGLTLAGGVESGGSQIPGLPGGGNRRMDWTAGGGSASGGLDLQEESGGSVLLQEHGLLGWYLFNPTKFMVPNCTKIQVRTPYGETYLGDDFHGHVAFQFPCLVSYLENLMKELLVEDISKHDFLVMGMADGGDNGACLNFVGEGLWNWRGGSARVKLNEWGVSWDVGWNRGRRMDTSSSGENKGANPFLPAED